jgi:two-component system sensor histidine kinase HydH
MDTLGQSSLVVGLISFALGASVLSRNVRNILFLSFAAVTTLISFWSLAFFFDKMWPDYGFYRFHLFFNVLLAPASLYFIRVMVRIQDGVSRRLLDFSILMAVFLSVAILFNFETHPVVLQLIYFSPGLIAFQTLQLMWIDRRLKKGFKRLPKMPTVGLGRRTLIYIGALLVLMTSVMDHVPWMGQALPSVGNLALAVYLFFLSQAITQQRLLNINALISRFLVLLAVALTLTGVYSLLVAWIENSPGLFFLNSFIASFLILTLLDPIRTLVGYFTQRLLTQKHQRLLQTLREAQRKLTGVVDLGALSQAVLATAEQTLQPEWAALFILRSDGTKFRRVRLVGREPEPETEAMGLAPAASPQVFREILANHPILLHAEDLARKGKFPIVLDQILENDIDRSASRVLREHYSGLIQGLKALNSNLLIPLIDSGKMLGFITLWVPSPPEPWGNNWGLLPIIYPYFQQAAQTMQSLEVYARQREKERLAALGEMAAGLAHEIRNPLGAIKGAAQFLDPSADRPESKFLKVIVEEVDRLNRVVTQFLDYSKPPTVDFALVDVSQLASKTIEMLRPEISVGIELEYQASRSPATVMASAGQLSQILINLIQNSHHALSGKPRGMIRVSVNVEGESANREVTLVVEDTGHGIKKEHLEKLFIPFFTTSPGGTGLGLSISQKIVEAHRGRIEVASEEARFTRFTVVLPFVK